jgi:hypothetical protein
MEHVNTLTYVDGTATTKEQQNMFHFEPQVPAVLLL